MRQRRILFIATLTALLVAVATQVAAQLAASAAASATARGINENIRLAGILMVLGMVFAGTGVVLWLTSAFKRQTPSHTLPLTLLVLYVFLIMTMV